MDIKQENVNKIVQLCGAASALSNVTSSDAATNLILSRIVELAQGPATVKATITKEATARAEADAEGVFNLQGDGTVKINIEGGDERPLTALEKWGRFSELCQKPGATLAEINEAAKALGYSRIGVVMA